MVNLLDKQATLQAEVSQRIDQLDTWSEYPTYGEFDLGRQLRMLDHISYAAQNAGFTGVDDVHEQTESVVRDAHDLYSRKKSPESLGLAAVQTVFFGAPRIQTRGVAGHVWEAQTILPSTKFIDPSKAQRFSAELPPTIIERYGENGALMMTPVYVDMIDDMLKAGHTPDEIAKKAREIIARTTDFAIYLGATAVGYGGTLPGLAPRRDDIMQTNGHAGTVHLIRESLKHAIEHSPQAQTIGVLGARGAIGRGTLEVLAGDDAFADWKLLGFDKRSGGDVEDERQLLEQSDIIISAITTRIDLDTAIDPGQNLDLSGKIIIDDSQPMSFDEREVLSRGGLLAGVIGTDRSESGFATAKQGTFVGPGRDFVRKEDVFGCLGELMTITQHDASIALASMVRVTPTRITQVGEAMRGSGIVVTDLQVNGRMLQF